MSGVRPFGSLVTPQAERHLNGGDHRHAVLVYAAERSASTGGMREALSAG